LNKTTVAESACGPVIRDTFKMKKIDLTHTIKTDKLTTKAKLKTQSSKDPHGTKKPREGITGRSHVMENWGLVNRALGT